MSGGVDWAQSVAREGLLRLAVSLATLSGKLYAFNGNNGEDLDIGIG